MQKTLRINLLARNQSVKRAKKTKSRKLYDEWTDYKSQDVGQEKILRNYLKEERLHRREDWKLGPLAPQRDAGKRKGQLGAIAYDVAFNPEIPKEVRKTPKEPGYSIMSTVGDDPKFPLFTGTTIVGNVVAGDRVVVVKGATRIRGQIGFVTDIDTAKEEVKISNVNIVDVEKPSIMMPEPTKENPEPERIFTQEVSVPMSSVRLVVRDEDSGQEYIVSQVHAGGNYIQRKFGHHLPAHTRYITGSEKWSKDGQPIKIPWPEEELVEEVRETLGDSARDEVEQSTWTPSMYNSPLGYAISHETIDTSEPETAYLAGYADKSKNASPLQLLGLAGFSNRTKAEERQNRIAQGIMDEFRNKRSRSAVTQERIDYASQKILEDARSIWWKERQLLSPAELKVQLDIKQAQEARKAQMIALSQTVGAEESAADHKSQENQIARERSGTVLDPNTQGLVQMMQQATTKSIYQVPDRKLRKQIEHEKVLPPKPTGKGRKILNV